MRLIYGPISEWKSLDTTATAQMTRFGNRITEFMKLSKSCAMASNSGCMSKSTVKNINSGTLYAALDTNTSAYKGILADGTSFAIIPYGSGYNFLFDIDGPNKGSNTAGKDIFGLIVSNDTVAVPRINFTIADLGTNSGEAHTNWVVMFDNMDYLVSNVMNGKCNSGVATLNTNSIPPVTSCR